MLAQGLNTVSFNSTRRIHFIDGSVDALQLRDLLLQFPNEPCNARKAHWESELTVGSQLTHPTSLQLVVTSPLGNNSCIIENC